MKTNQSPNRNGHSTEEDLKHLRDQIDGLQIRADESRKPFYRSPGTIISITALARSLVTVGYSILASTRHTVREKHDSLLSVLKGMLALEDPGPSVAPLPVLSAYNEED